MDYIKQWTLTVSTTLIIAIIFSILSPKGSMGKFFKIILTLFIFVSFIYPVKNADFKLDFPAFDSLEIEDEQKQVYESIITKSIISSLDDAGYFSSNVNVNVSYKDNEIELKSLKVYILDEFNKNEVEDYIFDTFGFKAEVYYFGE